jgi:hypothetical protein
MIATGERVSARYGLVPTAGSQPRFEIEVRVDGRQVWRVDGVSKDEACLHLFEATKTSPVRYDDLAVSRALVDVFFAFSTPHKDGLADLKQKLAADAARAQDGGDDDPSRRPRSSHPR